MQWGWGGHGQAGADEGRQHFLIYGAEIASLELVWDTRMEGVEQADRRRCQFFF